MKDTDGKGERNPVSVEKLREMELIREESEIQYFSGLGWTHPCRGLWESPDKVVKIVHVHSPNNENPVEYGLKYKFDISRYKSTPPACPEWSGIRPDSKDGYFNFPFYGKSPRDVLSLFNEVYHRMNQ